MATRITAFILAFLFLVSTIGFSIYVLFNGQETNQPDPVATGDYQPTAQELAEAQAIADDISNGEVSILEDFTPSSIRVEEIVIEDIVVGEGQEVVASDTITVHYTGALVSDGGVFDTSHPGEPVTFGLDGLIEGWQIGIPGMKVGGKRRLTIPAAQAYGDQVSGGIPANSDLVFDIELVGVSN